MYSTDAYEMRDYSPDELMGPRQRPVTTPGDEFVRDTTLIGTGSMPKSK